MDNKCIGCGKSVGKTSKRCNSCHNVYRYYGTNTVPVRNCKTCGMEMKPPIPARSIFCSRPCVYADKEVQSKLRAPRNSINKECPHCKVSFSVPVSNADRYNYCSADCSRNARGVTKLCKRCGGRFREGLSVKRYYCSESCRRPPVIVTCKECDKEFRIVPSREGRRRFCSQRCYLKFNGETSIERIVRVCLEEEGAAHEAQAQVGPWVVDFLVGDSLVIEADGDYWHSLRPDVDKRKTADLESRGYFVLRFTETIIKKPDFKKVLIESLLIKLEDQSSAAAVFP